MQETRPLTKPAKQRKIVYLAPAHLRHKLLAAHFSPELRASHGIRSLAVRSGDTVRVVRGDHRGVEGKITRVDLSKYRIYVEGLTREKVDGTTVPVPVHPSKVLVTHLNLDDKWRKQILENKKLLRERKARAPERAEAKPKPEEKPREKPEEVEKAKVVAEKPAPKEKTRKKAAGTKKRTVRKKTEEKTETESKEAQKEEKTEPKKKARRSGRKTTKKAEEGEA